MYGGNKTLIMEPPHIIITGNKIFDQDLLSKDRWINYEIIDSDNFNMRKLKPAQVKKLREKEIIKELKKEEKKRLLKNKVRKQVRRDLEKQIN